jgi:hypothetical protein
MKLYGAIDLHCNNNVTVLIDEKDKVVYQKRLTNDLPLIVEQLSPYASSLEGIVVESTYNWYWLVDGLMEKEHRVHLANTAAIQQYEGLKYTDDDSDARWLAHLFRLGVYLRATSIPKKSGQSGILEGYKGCQELLSEAIAAFGLTSYDTHDAFSIFMNKKIGADGRMIILPPTVKTGESIDLLAEMDLLIAISACPSGKAATNNFVAKSLGVEILESV